MKSSLITCICVALLFATFAAPALAGQIWIDGNGDGLPDEGCPQVFPAAPSTNVTVGIWIDSQSFTWTSYSVYVEWDNACLTYVSAEYVITGGENAPFTTDVPFGFGGTEYNESGVDHIGSLTLHIDAPIACCVSPIIDPNNPNYTFSQLRNGSSYFLFTTNPGTCYGAPPPPAGACCFADGSCQVIDASQCASAGGAYQGDCTVCSEAGCESETQACCFCPTGECQDLTIEDCIAAGGVLQGPGTTCGPPFFCGCPPPYGACCYPDGSCTDTLLEPECVGSGGEWQGVYTNCSGQCVATSAESSTWGRVKALFR